MVKGMVLDMVDSSVGLGCVFRDNGVGGFCDSIGGSRREDGLCEG